MKKKRFLNFKKNKKKRKCFSRKDIKRSNNKISENTCFRNPSYSYEWIKYGSLQIVKTIPVPMHGNRFR